MANSPWGSQAVVGTVGGASTGVTWAGVTSASVPSVSDLITINSPSKVFTITAGAGVSNLLAAVQVALDAGLTNWQSAGQVSLTAPGSGTVKVALPYYGYRINVIAIAGGSCSASVAADAAANSNSLTNPIISGVPANTPVIVARSAIPIINPPTGSMGNNGALTLGTALPFVYPRAYIMLKAGDIYAGSAAGTYYCVFSSTTVCTVYNNLLTITNGVIVPPVTPTPFVCTGAGAGHPTTNTINDLPAFSVPIAGGVLGLNGEVNIKAGFIISGASSSGQFYLGGTLWKAVPTASNPNLQMNCTLRNRGAQNKQIASSLSQPNETTISGNGVVEYAVDTSIEQAVTITSYTGAATVGYAVLDWFSISVVQA